jgi:alpha-amylase
VICNGKADGEKRCEVGKEHAGEKWTDVMGWHQGEVTIEEGKSSACIARRRLTE